MRGRAAPVLPPPLPQLQGGGGDGAADRCQQRSESQNGAQLRRMRRTKRSLQIFLLMGFSRPQILSEAPAAHFALVSLPSLFLEGPF